MAELSRDQRGGRADRFVEVADRLARNEVAGETVVVDDFGDFRLLDAVDGLGVFVVIDQGDADARRVDEVGFGNDAGHFAGGGINHGKQVLIGAGEAFAHARDRLGRENGHELRLHDVAHGARAADQGVGAGGVLRATQKDDALGFGEVADFRRDRVVAGDK